VYKYKYKYIYVPICIFEYVNPRSFRLFSIHTYICICIYINAYIYLYIYLYTYIHAYIHIPTCMRIYTHMYTHLLVFLNTSVPGPSGSFQYEPFTGNHHSAPRTACVIFFLIWGGTEEHRYVCLHMYICIHVYMYIHICTCSVEYKGPSVNLTVRAISRTYGK
jgi:hypothetical protein